MKYHIIVSFVEVEADNGGKRIASFIEEQGRDVCFDAFIEYWGEKDCTFEKEND